MAKVSARSVRRLDFQSTVPVARSGAADRPETMYSFASPDAATTPVQDASLDAQDADAATSTPDLADTKATGSETAATATAPAKPVRQPRPRTEPQSVPAARAVLEAGAGWDAFPMPTFASKQRRVPSMAALLSGPTSAVPLFLPKQLKETAIAIRRTLKEADTPITYRALFAYGLAYAYTHADAWLDKVPVDGRLRAGTTSLTTSSPSRSTLMLTRAMRDATDTLMLRASKGDSDFAVSAENLKTTALAWALSCAEEWMHAAVEAAREAPIAV